jgi:cell division transport system permease protein
MSENAEELGKKGLRTSYISTVIGISLVLFMIGLVLGGVFGLQSVQKQAKESLQGDIFFKSELNDADIKQVELQLKSWKEFKDVYFVSPESAIKEFGGENKNEQDMLAIFSGENPLPPTICFHPNEEFANKSGMVGIKKKLFSRFKEEIDEVNYDKATVENVNLGFKQFVLLFLSVALLLIIIAVAMINNTIRLALYSKRFTIKTMQLVGATGSYIRKPFLWQAILQGVVSAIIGLALLLTVFYAWNNVLISFEISYSLSTFLMLVGSMIIIGIFMTFISTWFALNKYLRMKLDDLY